MSSPFLEPGTLFAKDFRVTRILAQGGMGAVYDAVDTTTDKRVALKLMHPSQVSDPKLRRRFAQEARVGSWIGSEHIVDVFRAGVDESTGVPWLAMEFLEGETVAARIAPFLPSRGMPADDAWRVLSQLCRALIAAHGKGVVHRDLKPENVFLTREPRVDAPFTVKVLDFGIAKRLSDNDRASNRTSAIGTPLWMAPEQNETAEITPAADVWAVGLLTFRMFTGRFYWLSANEAELNLGWLYSELVTDPLVSARERAELLGCELLLPPGYSEWFSRCVVRDPTKRFASAREMTDALVAFAPRHLFAADGVAPPQSAPPPPPSSSPEGPSTAPTLIGGPQGPVMLAVAATGALNDGGAFASHAPGLSSSPPPVSSSPPAGASRVVVIVAAAALIVAGVIAIVVLMTRDATPQSDLQTEAPRGGEAQIAPPPPNPAANIPGAPGPMPAAPTPIAPTRTGK